MEIFSACLKPNKAGAILVVDSRLFEAKLCVNCEVCLSNIIKRCTRSTCHGATFLVQSERKSN